MFSYLIKINIHILCDILHNDDGPARVSCISGPRVVHWDIEMNASHQSSVKARVSQLSSPDTGLEPQMITRPIWERDTEDKYSEVLTTITPFPTNHKVSESGRIGKW